MAEGIGASNGQAKPLPIPVVTEVCGVSNSGALHPHGDLAERPCNAIETIEHLDFDYEPPCEGHLHDGTVPAATWIGIPHIPCHPYPTGFVCGGCRQWWMDRAHLLRCRECYAPEVTITWEPLR